MADDERRDPLDEHVDRLWERQKTTASDAERARWERALQVWHSAELPWWRRIPGLRPKPPRLPPREPGTRRATAPHPDWPPGFPLEGFFAARDQDVDQSLADEGPGPDFPGVEAKMLSPVEVATLGEILGAGKYDELVEGMSNSEREGEGGACGLYRVSREIRDALATADVESAAARWGATEELRASGWQADDARDTVGELRELAARARAEGKQLWVWWSV
jgi:hypothetical protein